MLPPTTEPSDETLASLDPAAIASELRLDTTDTPDFGKLRRSFALRNHPDLVAPHLRQRALARMQVANRLIDEAKATALAKARP